MTSDNSTWVSIYILDGSHFSFLDANADPGTTGLALTLLLTKTRVKKLM
jgi:hypothetical protein